MDNERERDFGTNQKLNAMEEKTIYQVTGYQLLFANGRRDNVKLLNPATVDDIEKYRIEVMRRHGCAGVNLTYVKIN